MHNDQVRFVFTFVKEIKMTKKQKLNTLFVVALLVGLLSWSLSITSMRAHAASRYYVKEGGTEDCSDWDHACDLQKALSIAEKGEEIWVAAGTYYPTGGTEREATFQLKSGVKILGGFPKEGGTLEQRNWETNPTILSGDIGEPNAIEDNSYHVVTGSGVDEKAVLDGFIITGGNANKPEHDRGGGMTNIGGSPTLRNLLFVSNDAVAGGGMYNEKGTPKITRVTFQDNTALKDGGGMFNVSGSPALIEVNFIDNRAHQGGGLSNYLHEDQPKLTLTKVTFNGNLASGENYTYGGGMYTQGAGASSLLTDVSFINNSTQGTNARGGGIYYMHGDVVLLKVTFSGNSVNGEDVAGGGMCHDGESEKDKITMENVTFSGNQAKGTKKDEGAGLYSGSIFRLFNATFTENFAGDSGGAVFNASKEAHLINAILWGNKPDQIAGEDAKVSYSIVEGGYPGYGNLKEDPKLLPLTDNGGFTLTHALVKGSPAIDTGTDEFCPKTDQRDVERPIDGDGDGDPVCDMGAYEFDPKELTLMVFIEPEKEAGTVQVDPSPPYYKGSIITLTAVPEVGWIFAHWDGGVTGDKNPIKFEIKEDTKVVAVFKQAEYKLTIHIDPENEAGKVQVDKPGPYHYNDVVTLTALPNPGWSFSHWNDDPDSTDEELEITIEGDTTVTAHFTQDEYKLKVGVLPEEAAGTVKIEDEQSSYLYGDKVKLTAEPEAGWSFSHWSGDASGDANPLVITIEGDTTVTAHFKKVEDEGFKYYFPLILR